MHLQSKIITELVKRVSKRDITIRKVQSFPTTYILEKKNDEKYTIVWLIVMEAHPYICGSRKCDFCLCGKLLIDRANLELKFIK